VGHHGDAIGQTQRLFLIVRDDHRCGASRTQDGAHLDPQARAQAGVQVGERLVEQHDARRGRQGAGQRNALLLTAGELVRVAAGLGCHADQVERRGGASIAVRAVVDAVVHVAGDGQVRKKRALLEHHADPSSLGRRPASAAGDRLAADAHHPGLGSLEAGDGPQEAGLAAAARPDQRRDLAVRDGERQVVDGNGHPVANGQSLHFQNHRALRHLSFSRREPAG
jgi:hypothetical protein